MREHFRTGRPFCATLPPPRVTSFYDHDQNHDDSSVHDGGATAEAPAAAAAGVADGIIVRAPATGVPTALPSVATSLPPVLAAPAAAGAAAPGLVTTGVTRSRWQRTGTLMRVCAVTADGPASSGVAGERELAVQLEAVGRARLHEAWVTPGGFGLLHAAALSLTDVDGDAALPVAEVPAASTTGTEEEQAAVIAQRIVTMWREFSAAEAATAGLAPIIAARMRRLLRSWDAQGRAPPDAILPPVRAGTGTAAAPAPQREGAVTPEALSWRLAELLPVPGTVKQLYLDTASTSQRLQRQWAYLLDRQNVIGGSVAASAAGGLRDTRSGEPDRQTAIPVRRDLTRSLPSAAAAGTAGHWPPGTRS
jgi:hypothetical protein